ncbi:Glu/Leu/Phe/Val dehydrogenase dimerization domain-containing protein [Ruegeria atlantica]|uniref:Glu/Leu/Phe/Val dehydrogenase dimerization domain-containing protein n=1 Tax=Ruegeria atlantica TaxID=81569 RepID=UPI003F689E27
MEPVKGGIHYSPEANYNKVEALASLMSLGCSLVNVPFGGSKDALAISPNAWTEDELEKITRRFYPRAGTTRLNPPRPQRSRTGYGNR